MLGLLDRATQLTNLKKDTPCPEPLTCETALKTTDLAAMLLLAHDQTTERTVRNERSERYRADKQRARAS
jgi:hypothetical protein